jgi:hypothetical protein
MKKRIGAAVAGLGLMIAVMATGTAGAATATIHLSAPKVAVSLPSGCKANDFSVVNAPDGSYHGYIQATCSSHPKLFYISRSAQGTWAIRGTTIDMPLVFGIAVDNAGTYFVGKRGNHNLVLVRRNGNGSLSKVHVLDTSTSVRHPVRGVSVVAEGGNYWVVWDHTAGTPLEQARTIAPAFAPTQIAGTDSMYAPALVRSAAATTLYACRLSGDLPNEIDSTIASLTAGSKGFTDDKSDFRGCAAGAARGGGKGLVARQFSGHTYVVDQAQTALDSDRSGHLAPTALQENVVAALLIAGGRVTAITDDGTQTLAYVQNSDGSFSTTPSSTVSAAPVPVHQESYINRSGKLIRLLVQADRQGGSGTRLLEQVQQ